MDYRYYRGEGIELPPAIVRRLYLVRYITIFMIAAPPVLAFLMLVGMVKPSLFWFFASFLMGTFGNVFFIIGMAYDTVVDRNGHTIIRWRFRLPWKRGEDKEFRPGRKMLYDLDETPEDPIENH